MFNILTTTIMPLPSFQALHIQSGRWTPFDAHSPSLVCPKKGFYWYNECIRSTRIPYTRVIGSIGCCPAPFTDLTRPFQEFLKTLTRFGLSRHPMPMLVCCISGRWACSMHHNCNARAYGEQIRTIRIPIITSASWRDVIVLRVCAWTEKHQRRSTSNHKWWT